MSALDRFADRVALDDDGCLVWLGGTFKSGYGAFYLAGKNHRAHRWLWVYLFGQTEQQVEHRCRNRRCVRPDHLRLATNKQNAENRTVRQGNPSGLRGVSWVPRLNKWAARYCHNGINVWLGTFSLKEDAADAVRVERDKHFTHNEEDRKTA